MNTDSNTNNLGFSMSYAINKCQQNCSNNATNTNGICRDDGSCECIGSRDGKWCQYNWCPDLCHQATKNGACNVVSQQLVNFTFFIVNNTISIELYSHSTFKQFQLYLKLPSFISIILKLFIVLDSQRMSM